MSIHRSNLRPRNEIEEDGGEFTAQLNLERNIETLFITPNVSNAVLDAFLQNSETIKGLMLLSYGAGNIPSNNEYFLEVLQILCERGVIILNCTQCFGGGVANLYEAGSRLYEIGVISGFDMVR